MSDLETINEMLAPFVPPEERWQPLHKNMRWAIVDLVRRVRLETLRNLHGHDCEVFTRRETLTCGCLARAIAALEQAAGGSAAGKGE